MLCIRQVYPKKTKRQLSMKKEYLVIEDSVVQEYVCISDDGQIVCYQHPDLVDAYSEAYYADMSSDEDQAVLTD